MTRPRCPLHPDADAALTQFVRDVVQLIADCPVCETPDAMVATYTPAHHGRPGRVLARCKTGCRAAAITRALGLDPDDLYDGPSPLTRRLDVARPYLAAGQCPACDPDWIDATFNRLYGGAQ